MEEDREREIFLEKYTKQMRLLRIVFLSLFCAIGAVFLLLGIILAPLDSVDNALIIIYICIGLFFILFGIICFFAIPKNPKFNYEKYRARVEKYGGVNYFEMYAKIESMEKRIEDLENKLK